MRLPTLSVRIMTAVLHQEGIDATSAFHAAGVSPDVLSDPKESLGADQELAFQRAFVSFSRDKPNVWTRAGLHYRMLSYGDYGLTVITSSSFRQAIATGVRDDLSYSLAHYRPIQVDGALVGLEGDLSEVPADMQEFTVYRDFGAIIAAFRDLWGGPFPFTLIELPVAAPTDSSFLQSLGYDVVFNRRRAAYRWKPEVQDRTLFHGDPVLHDYYLDLLAAQLSTFDPRDDFLACIELHLGQMEGAQTSLSQLARRMGISGRTLQRRLLERGLNFRSVIANTRMQLSIELLETTPTSISEIAWKLGYSEVASFNHAFRRWAGISPRTFRAQRQPLERDPSFSAVARQPRDRERTVGAGSV